MSQGNVLKELSNEGNRVLCKKYCGVFFTTPETIHMLVQQIKYSVMWLSGAVVYNEQRKTFKFYNPYNKEDVLGSLYLIDATKYEKMEHIFRDFSGYEMSTCVIDDTLLDYEIINDDFVAKYPAWQPVNGVSAMHYLVTRMRTEASCGTRFVLC